jgi:nicotinamidase/pyrazinamidase
MNALIIIDAQNDFMPGGSLEVPNGDTIVPVINDIQGSFELIVATQDWHPQNHISFATNHNKKPFEEIEVGNSVQTLWPDHCVQGSHGAQFHHQLNTNRIEAIFRKGTDCTLDSYSGFYDNQHLKKTGLAGYLREKEAKKLYFCGLCADICVYFSIKDAIKEGFSCCLIEDATQPLVINDFIKIKKKLIMQGVEVIQSKNFRLP